MLLSTLISLTPTSDVLILGPLGRPAQAWFLGQVRRYASGLAEALHSESRPREYTVSTLVDDHGLPIRFNTRLRAGQSCWLRITTLTEQLSTLALEKLFPNLPGRLEFYKMPFRVDGYTLNRFQHPWASQSTYLELSETRQGRAESSSQVRLEFASPTTFRSSGVNIPLPEPGLVFRSLFERWNAFAPEPMRIDPVWPSFAANAISIEDITDLNTDSWVYTEHSREEIGYTGAVQYHLLPKKKIGNFSTFRDGAEEVLHLLACYAFYSGVGSHTSIGMGQARPVVISKDGPA